MLSSMTLIPAGLQRIEMEQAQKKESMHDLLNECLNGRENMIVTKRFGMDGEEKQTLAQLGESLDLSRERIRQIERNALRKMKKKAWKLAG